MKRLRRFVTVLAALVALWGAPAVGAQESALEEAVRAELGEPMGEPLAGAEREERAHEIGSLLRCPVCQGLSVADSPVPAALSMQAEVERLVGAGYTEEQILAHFETAYGEFIRLSPKPEGFNLVVWILPFAAVLLGVAIVARRVRTTPSGSTEADLDAYRRKVREALKR